MQNSDEERLAKGILWMIRVRWIIVTFPYLIFLRVGQTEQIRFGLVYGLIPWVAYSLNIVYYILVRRRKYLLYIAYFQMIVDLVVITLGVHLAGGLASWFGVLIYPIVIIAAAILLSTKTGFLMATISSILYSGMVGMEYFKVIPLISILGVEGRLYENIPYVIISLATRVVFFYWIAIVSGHLADEIRQGREELKGAYDELKQTQDQLIQSAKLSTIGQMAAGMAHELRNPLNVINSAAYCIKSRVGKERPELLLNLEHIESEVARADRLITSLLGFSKPIVSIGSIDVNALMDDTLLFLEKEVSLSNIEIVKEYGQGLAEIAGDRSQLQEVFLNIILNACQAMPQGGRLRIKSRELKIESEEFVEIIFEDTGAGIPEEDIPKVFEPFFSTKEKGTGLGLAISHQIIQRHKGEIIAESTLGEGTSFIVRLPVSQKTDL